MATAMTATAVTATSLAVSGTHLVSVKVIECLVTMCRKRTVIAVMWIKAVVHVADKVVVAMEQGAGSDKDTSVEPFRPVIPVGSATVGGVVEVTVGACRLRADADGDASRCRAWCTRHC